MRLTLVVCVLVSVVPILCSATALSPGYSSIWEYLLEQQTVMKSFQVGKVWTDCTKPTDHGKIIDLTWTPNPPKRGADILINATASIDEDISGGTVSALVTLGNVPYEQDYDICDLVQYVNLACPIKKGKFSVGMKMNVPDFIPAGDYSGKAVAKDQNQQTIFCVNFNMHLD